MKSTTTRALVLAALSASLTISACKKDTPEETDTPATNGSTTTAPAETTAKTNNDTPEPVAVDETMFIKAYFEVTCVQTRLDDPGKIKEIIAEVMPRYGFDETTYKAAEAAVAKKPNIEAALKAKMEGCATKEYAEGLLTAGATTADAATADAGTADAGAPDAKAEETPKPKPKPKFASSVTQRNIKGSGVSKGMLTIKNPKKDVLIGAFKGVREGRAFNFSLSGKVASNGSFTVSGKQGSNNVSITGKLGKSSATGTLKGSINKQPVSLKVNAR